MKREDKKIKIIFLSLLLIFLSVSFVSAVTTETDFPTVIGEKPDASTTFPQYVRYLFNFSMFVGALLVLGVVVWSGFRYLTSGNNPAVTSDVKKKIYQAFLGFLILLSAYLILTTINPGLVILSLPSLFSPATSTTPGTPITKASSTFQEIPLGTIIEDLLAGNASTTAHPDLRCYKYDSEGNTVDVNGDGVIDGSDTFNYNSFYCVSLINEAFKTKVKSFIDRYNKEMKPLLNGCSCSSCATYPFALYSYGCMTKNQTPPCSKDCGCRTYCDSHCSCCGKARGEDAGCPGTDPCPKAVRQNIDCKRQELKQLVDGGELLDKAGKSLCPSSYDPTKDPKKNPGIKFLTLEAARGRAEAFYLAFVADLNDLKEAELLMKTPYGKRSTMAEFIELKIESSKPIEKTEFKTYNTNNYCKEFKCDKTNAQGYCIECSLNSENRMCKISGGTEYYVKTGDGATFYFNEAEAYKSENVISGEKCTIDPKEEKGFQVGLIPIGETVDEAEKLGTRMLALYDLLFANYQNAMNAALNLIDSPDNCNCSRCSNKANCNTQCCCNCSCGPGSTCSGCSTCGLTETKQATDPYDATGLAWKREYGCCGTKYYIPRMETLPNICPVEEIDQEMKNINNESADKNDYYCCKYLIGPSGTLIAEIATTTSWAPTKKTKTVKVIRDGGWPLETKDQYYKDYEEITYPEALGYLQIIDIVYKKMEDLFNAKNLEPDELNRCQILDKLTISREKMEKCVTGFGVPDKAGAAKERTLSCSSAWDLIRSADKSLVILPIFPNPTRGDYLNCYPYNSADLTDGQKLRCLQNRTSPECASSSYYLLDNYYCCTGYE